MVSVGHVAVADSTPINFVRIEKAVRADSPQPQGRTGGLKLKDTDVLKASQAVPPRDLELERAKAQIAKLRYALNHAPPKQSITDQRYWAWLSNYRDKALDGSLEMK